MAEPVRDDLVSDRPGTAAERASRCSRIPRLHAEAVAQRGRPPVAPTARPCRTATSTSLLRNACWYCPRPRLSSQRAMSIAVYPAWVTSPRMWPTPCRTRNRAGLTTFRRGSGVIQFTRPRSSPYAPCELTHMTTTPPALSWSTDVKSDLGSWEVLKEHGRGDNRRRSREGRRLSGGRRARSGRRAPVTNVAREYPGSHRTPRWRKADSNRRSPL